MAELSADPYLPLIGTIPAEYSDEAGRAYLERQHQRLHDEAGFSFAVARRIDDVAVGGAGLWLAARWRRARDRFGGLRHRAAVPERRLRHRRPGWPSPGSPGRDRTCDRVDLYIEPDNAASIAVAEHAGYLRLGLLPGHDEIGGRRRDMFHYRAFRPR